MTVIMDNSNSNLLELIAEKLDAKGIDLIVDGTSYIYIDRKSGIKVVDFKNGLGAIGTALALNGDLTEVGEKIAQALPNVVLSDNQMAALTSFAQHIGIDNFVKSKVFEDLNETPPAYFKVPAHMKRWRTGTVGNSKKVKVRQDYVDRRLYEGILFNTPDTCDIDQLFVNQSNTTFAQMATRLRKRNLDFIASGGLGST